MSDLVSFGESADFETFLSDHPILEDLDRPLARRYVTMYEEWLKLRTIREQEGAFTESPQGGIVAHPVMGMLSDLQRQMLAIEKEIGMTPASRLKLGADAIRQKKEEAGLSALLDGLEED